LKSIGHMDIFVRALFSKFDCEIIDLAVPKKSVTMSISPYRGYSPF